MNLAMRDADEASRLIIELASTLIKTMQSMQQPWMRAFVRFEMTSSTHWGCNGSYETLSGIALFDPFSNGRNLFAVVNEVGPRLQQAASTPEREIMVFLVTVDSDFNYKIDFDSTNANRWQISKRNGGTGIPVGLHK